MNIEAWHTYSDYDEYIWRRVSNAEYTRPTQGRNVLSRYVIGQHLLDRLGRHVEIKVFGYFLLFFGIVQSHRREQRFQF